MLTRRAKGGRKGGPEDWIVSGKDPPGTEVRFVSGDVALMPQTVAEKGDF